MVKSKYKTPSIGAQPTLLLPPSGSLFSGPSTFVHIPSIPFNIDKTLSNWWMPAII